MSAIPVKYSAVRYLRGAGLDIGCGTAKAFPNMIGVDTERAELTVPDVADLSGYCLPASCDFVYCAKLPEKLEAANWWALIKDGGYLVLVGSTSTIEAAVAACADKVAVLAEDHEEGWLCVFQKGGDDVAPRPAKTVCIVRHGGYGDQLQAACLFPQLKREGYRITVLTTPKGRSVLEHEPHVDDWFMVDNDQIPNAELGMFWRATAAHYDKFINLNESVEGTLLALPGRIQHTWPHSLRHRMLNHNYGEFAASLAEIPFVAEGKFYETDEERTWAQGLRAEWAAEDWQRRNGGGPAPFGIRAEPQFVIVWALAGSSPHKFTPHQDAVIGAILARLKRAIVVLVGDLVCRVLEAGWEDEPRVKRLSGHLSIRQTLALAKEADLVIGPETGVLNAVAFEPMPKVVLLSHSSPENLTKHWTNVYSIEGVAPCWPCHQLHYTSEFCPRDATTHAAICQQGVNPRHIYAPIDAEYTAWAKVQLLRSAA